MGSLLSVPGASNSVLEVVVPYSKMSLIHLLGKVLFYSSSIYKFAFVFLPFYSHCFCSFLQIPSQFCSQQTAEDMALLAYNRALKLSTPGSILSLLLPNINIV